MMMLWFIFFTSWAQANECRAGGLNEELEVYLLTSGPGNGLYTKVGHSALWVSGASESNTVFNWGAYDGSQENFLWKFFMGTAHYQLFMMHPTRNIARVKSEKQILYAQHLNLPPKQKEVLQQLLHQHALPENRTYLYHWEQQNCATLIRDILDSSTNGALHQVQLDDLPSKREEVLRHMFDTPWLWFGWHFMASDYADEQYESFDILHIPVQLMNNVSKATIVWEDGVERPLVDHTCILNEGQGWAAKEVSSRWTWFWGSGLGLAALGFLSFKHRILKIIQNCILMGFFFFSGSLSLFFIICWIFSNLDGYGWNENWFFAHPLHFFGGFLIWRAPQKIHDIISKIWFLLSIFGLIWHILDPTPQQNLDIIGFFLLPTIALSIKWHQNKPA